MQLNILTPSGEQKFWFIAFLYVFQCALLITFLDYALKKISINVSAGQFYITHFTNVLHLFPGNMQNTQTLRHIYVHVHQM